jgi:NAD(P)-dependent dehydrogenase (short-subunit alcohol dehydrogenase family)
MKIPELFDVRDMVVAITGGAGGIGRGIAEGMAVNGAKVVLMDSDSKKLDATLTEMRPIGDVSGELIDVASSETLRAAYDSILRRHGRIDVVFANAGISNAPGYLGLDGARVEAGAIENLDFLKWNSVMATNLTGVMLTLRGAVPAMKKAQTAYIAAKAGAAQLVRHTAYELAKFNIRVNAIAPGPVVTGITRPGGAEHYARLVPMRRVPVPADIQGVALFLASRASCFITGAEIPIDGGARFGAGD